MEYETTAILYNNLSGISFDNSFNNYDLKDYISLPHSANNFNNIICVAVDFLIMDF